MFNQPRVSTRQTSLNPRATPPDVDRALPAFPLSPSLYRSNTNFSVANWFDNHIFQLTTNSRGCHTDIITWLLWSSIARSCALLTRQEAASDIYLRRCGSEQSVSSGCVRVCVCVCDCVLKISWVSGPGCNAYRINMVCVFEVGYYFVKVYYSPGIYRLVYSIY